MGSGCNQGWVGDGRALRLVRHDPGQPVDTTAWPATVPAVEHLLCEGLEFPAGLTVLVGENGSGKSTIVEMLARRTGSTPRAAQPRPSSSGPGTPRHQGEPARLLPDGRA